MIPRFSRWYRLGISAAALGILLIIIPVRSLLAAVLQMPATTLLETLVVVVAGHLCAATKWRLLQGEAGLPLVTTLRAHFAGVIANFWLPGVVGGDLVRVGAVVRQSTRPAVVALASLVDRVVDSIALLLLALAGLVAIGAPSYEARRVFVAVVASVAAGLAVLGCVYWYLRRHSSSRWLAPIDQGIEMLMRRPFAVVVAALMSAATQAAFILVNAQLGRAAGVDTSMAVWFMAWPLSKLVALAPISLAGIGIREAAIVMLMRPFTPASHAVMASSLLWQGLLFAGGVIGWSALTLAAFMPAGNREALELSRD
jgi:glycosyltransferase 2 family protein